MVNLAVAYAGPDGALAALAAKLRRIYGNPARTYEFVTGYKSAANVSGHNADANGRAHAMDIFVGPGNLSEAQGIDLAERLRAEGKRGKIPGHPDRLAYIIHRGQIAGDHTNWEWIPYTGADWHGDHIHVSSVFDYYWGDPIPGNPADYNSTADWDLWEAEFQPNTTTGQGSGITPITEEGFLMALPETRQAQVADAADRTIGTIPDRRTPSGAVVKVAMEDTTFSKADGAYQNRIQTDVVKALGRIENALGTKPDKTDLAAAILAGGSGDPSIIAKAVIDAVGDGLAKEVVEAIGAALSGGGK